MGNSTSGTMMGSMVGWMVRLTFVLYKHLLVAAVQAAILSFKLAVYLLNVVFVLAVHLLDATLDAAETVVTFLKRRMP